MALNFPFKKTSSGLSASHDKPRSDNEFSEAINNRPEALDNSAIFESKARIKLVSNPFSCLAPAKTSRASLAQLPLWL